MEPSCDAPFNWDKVPLRLSNLYLTCPDTEKVVGMIDKTHYDYFFCHLLTGKKGPVQAILSHFFIKLYQHFTEDLKVPRCWHENGREIMVKELLKLNFNDQSELHNKLKLAHERIAELELLSTPASVNRGPSPRRRAAPGSPKPPGKPKPNQRQPRAASSSRVQVPTDSSNPEQTEVNDLGGSPRGFAQEKEISR